MQPSEHTEPLALIEELIPGTQLLRRVDVASGREVAPEYQGAALGVQGAIAEATAHGYGAVRYGGRAYVRVGRTWYRINRQQWEGRNHD
jgi:hypothetical protein